MPARCESSPRQPRLPVKFPNDERKAIHDRVPWTRLVAATKTTYHEETVDLPDSIARNRDKLLLPEAERRLQRSTQFLRLGDGRGRLGPRAEAGHAFAARGAGESQPRPLRVPLVTYGNLEFKEMQGDVHPLAYLDKVLS
jgi:hypothetical protein